MLKALLITVLFIFSSLAYATDESITPVGQWQTIDDASKKPKSVVEIWEKNGKLYGKIADVLFYSEENKDGLCGKCTGERHNKPIKGMTNIWDLTQDPSDKLKWIDGQILDPKNGKTYNCQITLSEDGKTLSVHGYVGAPLFGRTQTWTRIIED